MKMGCLRILGIVGAIVVGAAGLTAGIGWRLGWSSAREFSDGFLWAGLILGGCGLLSLMGGYGMHNSPTLRVSETAGHMTLSERTRLWVADLEQGWAAAIILGVSGAALFGVSVLLTSLPGTAP